MAKKDITSIRGTIDFLKEQKELLIINNEVDPIYEIAGIQKALEESPALLFENIKGYPGVRNIGNIFSRLDRIAKILGVDDPKKVKFKCLEAIRKPIPPQIVKGAPCQEVVITDNIDVMAILPIIKHSERDGGHVLGSGINFVSGKYCDGGTEVCFKRMLFRSKDWGSTFWGVLSHLGKIGFVQHKGERIPVTININTPPAVALVAGGGLVHSIIHIGSDELGIAGALQGSRVEIIKAKTVDAYSIAQSEWVIEGYVDTAERVWETEEAEKMGKPGVVPTMPEWAGYMGRAIRPFKFQATAITHRKDRPIFYTPLADSFESDFLSSVLREACFLELAERLIPGLVIDVNTLPGMRSNTSVIYQVKKRRNSDDAYLRNILSAAIVSSPGLQLAIVVDEDVSIYSPNDVLWAIATRVNADSDVIKATGGLGIGFLPTKAPGGAREITHGGGLIIDATASYASKHNFERPKYPVDRIDLRKWLTEKEIAAIKASQSEYARLVSEMGW